MSYLAFSFQNNYNFKKNYVCTLKLSYFLSQTVTEKHKMNVPETMNEVLDMSDDEGIKKLKRPLAYFSICCCCKCLFKKK